MPVVYVVSQGRWDLSRVALPTPPPVVAVLLVMLLRERWWGGVRGVAVWEGLVIGGKVLLVQVVERNRLVDTLIVRGHDLVRGVAGGDHAHSPPSPIPQGH